MPGGACTHWKAPPFHGAHPTKDIQTYAGVANYNANDPLKKVCPSQAGGNNYWPSSYSPKTKLLYIPAISNCATILIDQTRHTKEKGWNGGYSSWNDRWESNLTAADPVTGEIKKTIHLNYANYSGTLATAGGLVFNALLDRAIADYDEAIRLNPKDAKIFCLRGGARAIKGDYDGAIADCDEAIRLDPKDACSFGGCGIAYATKGQYERALLDFDEAIRLDPKFAEHTITRRAATIAMADRGNAAHPEEPFELVFVAELIERCVFLSLTLSDDEKLAWRLLLLRSFG